MRFSHVPTCNDSKNFSIHSRSSWKKTYLPATGPARGFGAVQPDNPGYNRTSYLYLRPLILVLLILDARSRWSNCTFPADPRSSFRLQNSLSDLQKRVSRVVQNRDSPTGGDQTYRKLVLRSSLLTGFLVQLTTFSIGKYLSASRT